MKFYAFIGFLYLAYAKNIPPMESDFKIPDFGGIDSKDMGDYKIPDMGDFKIPDGKFEGFDTSDTSKPNGPDESGFDFGGEDSNPFGSAAMKVLEKVAEQQKIYQNELETAKPKTKCEFCNIAVAYTAIASEMLHLPKTKIEITIRSVCKSVTAPGNICELAVKNIDTFKKMAEENQDSTKMCELIGVKDCLPPEPTEAQKKIADMISGMTNL